MKFLLTCLAWLESLAKTEVLKQGGMITEVKDRLVFFEWPIELMAKVNLQSRVGNKLYLVLGEQKKIDTFDALYALVQKVDWKKYLTRYYPVIVKATSIKSLLSSTPAIQKIVKKAIVDVMTQKSGKIMPEEKEKQDFEVFTFLMEDTAYILLNTSWETLYKRGYKEDTWEAPIKESLAAALVILSNWKFWEPLYDITCGSGTIAIEAAMLARNIPPGLGRYFAFEDWKLLPNGYFETLRKEAKEKIYEKKYTIIASDLDPKMIEIAQQNAKNAEVDDTITFEVKDLKEYKKQKLSGTLVSNPPYGQRLRSDDLEWIYRNFATLFEKNRDLSGGIITSFTDFDQEIHLKDWKKRKLYNGGEMCYFYQKREK